MKRILLSAALVAIYLATLAGCARAGAERQYVDHRLLLTTRTGPGPR